MAEPAGLECFDRRAVNQTSGSTRRDRDAGSMKLGVQVVLHAEGDTETVVREAFTLQREEPLADTLGLQLAEARDLLAAVQDTLVSHRVAAMLSSQMGGARTAGGRGGTRTSTLKIRTRILNNTLTDDYRRWYPQLHPHHRSTEVDRVVSPGFSRSRG
jgi:hypothetical protein